METSALPLAGRMAPKVAMRRPGAAPGRGGVRAKGVVRMRRSVPAPGGRRRARGGDASGWKDGVVMQLSEVPLDEMTPGLHLVLMDASYYRSKCNVSGKVKSIEAAGADRYLFLVLTGTTNKDMLKVSTAKPDEAFKVHLCIRGCGEDEVGDFVIHAQKGRVVQDMALEEEWLLNLESVKGPAGHDELALLREREKRPDAPKEKDKEKVDSSSSSTRSRRKKKKKAKKKEAKKVKKRKKEDDVDDKPDKSKEEDPKKADGRSPMVDSTKPLETLFGGTGLDPRERVRRRVVRKARAYLKKRGNEKSSGSSSSSSATSSSKEGEDQEEMSLFQETSKCRALYERYPGVLAQASLVAMREALLLEMGSEVRGPVQCCMQDSNWQREPRDRCFGRF